MEGAYTKGVQKGQVAEATPPTAAGAAPELSIMRAPAAPSLPLPLPTAPGAAAVQVARARSALTQALLT